jgi:hypothetical protein
MHHCIECLFYVIVFAAVLRSGAYRPWGRGPRG